tara:strand:- start:965 stop:1177 length:213 start_codon:yes stop_codon:yes gene_type:complete
MHNPTNTWKNMARAHAAHHTAVRNRHNHPVAIRAAKRAVTYMKEAKRCQTVGETRLLKKEFTPSLFRFVQ